MLSTFSVSVPLGVKLLCTMGRRPHWAVIGPASPLAFAAREGRFELYPPRARATVTTACATFRHVACCHVVPVDPRHVTALWRQRAAAPWPRHPRLHPPLQVGVRPPISSFFWMLSYHITLTSCMVQSWCRVKCFSVCSIVGNVDPCACKLYQWRYIRHQNVKSHGAFHSVQRDKGLWQDLLPAFFQFHQAGIHRICKSNTVVVRKFVEIMAGSAYIPCYALIWIALWSWVSWRKVTTFIFGAEALARP